MFRYLVCLTLLVLTITSNVIAQRVKDPLTMIVSNYSPGTGVLETKLKYSYFSNLRSSILLDSMIVNYVESSKAIYTNYEGQEILSLDGLTIVILNSIRSISLVKGKKNDDRIVSVPNLIYLSNKKGSYKLLKVNSKDICRVYKPGPDIDSLDVLYNSQSFLINKIKLYYSHDFVPIIGMAAGTFLEIEYLKFNKLKNSSHPLLNMDTFGRLVDQNWIPSSKYSSYDISN